MKPLVFHLFFYLISLWGFSVSAEELFSEKIYRHTYEAFTGQNCNQKNDFKQSSTKVSSFGGKTIAACTVREPAFKKIAQNISEISDSDLYKNLVSQDIERLRCAKSFWSSADDYKKNSSNEILLDIYNKALPELNNIKTFISQLKLELAKIETSLSVTATAEQIKSNRRLAEQKNNYDEILSLIKQLNATYEAKVMSLPQATEPQIRKLIDKHAAPGFFNSKSSPITLDEFKSVQREVIDRIDNKISNYHKSLVKDGYTLNAEVRSDLISDPELIAHVLKENPLQHESIQQHLCLARERERGKTAASHLATGSMAALSLASLGLASGARLSFIALRAPQIARGAIGLSRAFSAGITAAGTSASLYEVMTASCFKGANIQTRNTQNFDNSCSADPQIILKDASYGQCIYEAATLAGSMYLRSASKYLNDRTQELDNYLNRVLSNPNLKQISAEDKNRLLATASSLQPEEQRALTEILYNNGRALTKKQSDALMKSHLFAEEKGYFEYSQSDLKEKIRILVKEGGFDEKDASDIIRAGLAGSYAKSTPRISSSYIERLAAKTNPDQSDFRLAAEEHARLGQIEAATDAYQKSYSVASKSLPNLNQLNEKKLRDLESLAARSGNDAAVATYLEKRLQLAQSQLNGQYAVKADAQTVFVNTLRENYREFSDMARSSDPFRSKEGAAMKAAFEKLYPNLKGR